MIILIYISIVFKRRNSMSITLEEIAKICGVSRGTVDRALHGRKGISPNTRKKILETAEKMGYRTNYIARSLAKGNTMTLGIVIFDLHNRFFAQLVNSIETKARDEGYFTYLTLTNKDMETEKKCIEHLVDRKVDGILLCSVNNTESYNNYLKSLKIPIVTILNKISDEIHFLSIDDRLSMKEATRYVINKGYKRIIYFSPALNYRYKTNIYAVEQRYMGFEDAIRENPYEVETFIVKSKNFAELFNKIDLNNKRTAVICTSDIYALEVMSYFKGRNIKIPEEVGIMGFDNIDVLKYVDPGLTTVLYPAEEISVQALEILLKLIKGENIEEVPVLKHKIIDRMSL